MIKNWIIPVKNYIKKNSRAAKQCNNKAVDQQSSTLIKFYSTIGVYYQSSKALQWDFTRLI